MENDYLSVVYDEKRTPKTDYPVKLASYLFDRFGFKAGGKILEIGCGRGELLAAFKELGLDCHGIDISDVSIEKQSNFNLQKVDVAKDVLPYEDNSFDIVYHKSLIEHLYSPEQLMRETHRVLKSGGRIIILTPDWQSVMKVFYEDFTHNKPYDVTAVRDLLKISGFSMVKAELFYQLPILWRYPELKCFSRFLQLFISASMGRQLTQITGNKFFRWSVELMVLGTGVKKNGEL